MKKGVKASSFVFEWHLLKKGYLKKAYEQIIFGKHNKAAEEE